MAEPAKRKREDGDDDEHVAAKLKQQPQTGIVGSLQGGSVSGSQAAFPGSTSNMAASAAAPAAAGSTGATTVTSSPATNTQKANTTSNAGSVGDATAAAKPAETAQASGSTWKPQAAEDAAKISGDQLAAFLKVMDDFTPTIPDEVIAHYLSRGGFATDDERLLRMVSLATQKFIADIAQDSLQYCKQRQAGAGSSKKSKDKNYTLTSADLSEALREHGMNSVKPQYYL